MHNSDDRYENTPYECIKLEPSNFNFCYDSAQFYCCRCKKQFTSIECDCLYSQDALVDEKPSNINYRSTDNFESNDFIYNQVVTLGAHGNRSNHNSGIRVDQYNKRISSHKKHNRYDYNGKPYNMNITTSPPKTRFYYSPVSCPDDNYHTIKRNSNNKPNFSCNGSFELPKECEIDKSNFRLSNDSTPHCGCTECISRNNNEEHYDQLTTRKRNSSHGLTNHNSISARHISTSNTHNCNNPVRYSNLFFNNGRSPVECHDTLIETLKHHSPFAFSELIKNNKYPKSTQTDTTVLSSIKATKSLQTQNDLTLSDVAVKNDMMSNEVSITKKFNHVRGSESNLPNTILDQPKGDDNIIKLVNNTSQTSHQTHVEDTNAIASINDLTKSQLESSAIKIIKQDANEGKIPQDISTNNITTETKREHTLEPDKDTEQPSIKVIDATTKSDDLSNKEKESTTINTKGVKPVVFNSINKGKLTKCLFIGYLAGQSCVLGIENIETPLLVDSSQPFLPELLETSKRDRTKIASKKLDTNDKNDLSVNSAELSEFFTSSKTTTTKTESNAVIIIPKSLNTVTSSKVITTAPKCPKAMPSILVKANTVPNNPTVPNIQSTQSSSIGANKCSMKDSFENSASVKRHSVSGIEIKAAQAVSYLTTPVKHSLTDDELTKPILKECIPSEVNNIIAANEAGNLSEDYLQKVQNNLEPLKESISVNNTKHLTFHFQNNKSNKKLVNDQSNNQPINMKSGHSCVQTNSSHLHVSNLLASAKQSIGKLNDSLSVTVNLQEPANTPLAPTKELEPSKRNEPQLANTNQVIIPSASKVVLTENKPSAIGQLQVATVDGASLNQNILKSANGIIKSESGTMKQSHTETIKVEMPRKVEPVKPKLPPAPRLKQQVSIEKKTKSVIDQAVKKQSSLEETDVRLNKSSTNPKSVIIKVPKPPLPTKKTTLKIGSVNSVVKPSTEASGSQETADAKTTSLFQVAGGKSLEEIDEMAMKIPFKRKRSELDTPAKFLLRRNTQSSSASTLTTHGSREFGDSQFKSEDTYVKELDDTKLVDSVKAKNTMNKSIKHNDSIGHLSKKSSVNLAPVLKIPTKLSVSKKPVEALVINNKNINSKKTDFALQTDSSNAETTSDSTTNINPSGPLLQTLSEKISNEALGVEATSNDESVENINAVNQKASTSKTEDVVIPPAPQETNPIISDTMSSTSTTTFVNEYLSKSVSLKRNSMCETTKPVSLLQADKLSDHSISTESLSKADANVNSSLPSKTTMKLPPALKPKSDENNLKQLPIKQVDLSKDNVSGQPPAKAKSAPLLAKKLPLKVTTKQPTLKVVTTSQSLDNPNAKAPPELKAKAHVATNISLKLPASVDNSNKPLIHADLEKEENSLCCNVSDNVLVNSNSNKDSTLNESYTDKQDNLDDIDTVNRDGNHIPSIKITNSDSSAQSIATKQATLTTSAESSSTINDIQPSNLEKKAIPPIKITPKLAVGLKAMNASKVSNMMTSPAELAKGSNNSINITITEPMSQPNIMIDAANDPKNVATIPNTNSLTSPINITVTKSVDRSNSADNELTSTPTKVLPKLKDSSFNITVTRPQLRTATKDVINHQPPKVFGQKSCSLEVKMPTVMKQLDVTKSLGEPLPGKASNKPIIAAKKPPLVVAKKVPLPVQVKSIAIKKSSSLKTVNIQEVSEQENTSHDKSLVIKASTVSNTSESLLNDTSKSLPEIIAKTNPTTLVPSGNQGVKQTPLKAPTVSSNAKVSQISSVKVASSDINIEPVSTTTVRSDTISSESIRLTRESSIANTFNGSQQRNDNMFKVPPTKPKPFSPTKSKPAIKMAPPVKVVTKPVLEKKSATITASKSANSSSFLKSVNAPTTPVNQASSSIELGITDSLGKGLNDSTNIFKINKANSNPFSSSDSSFSSFEKPNAKPDIANDNPKTNNKDPLTSVSSSSETVNLTTPMLSHKESIGKDIDKSNFELPIAPMAAAKHILPTKVITHSKKLNVTKHATEIAQAKVNAEARDGNNAENTTTGASFFEKFGFNINLF